MHTGFITIIAGALVLAATSPALSHHPSGTGTSSTGGPIVTIPGTTLQKGASALYFVFEHYSFDELSDAVLEAAAARHEHAHSLATLESSALGYSYGLTDRLMVSVQLPYVVRTGIREGAHHHHETAAAAEVTTVDRGDTEGVGDLTLFGQYRFYGQDSGLQASLLSGIKTPTGETGEHDDEGEVFEAEFQPGSGSWDPMVGIALSQAQGRWSVDGNVLYTIATEGTQHTDLGDRFHYNGAVTYRLKGGDAKAAHEVRMPHSHNGQSQHHEHASSAKGLVIDAVLELNGEWQEKQTISGATDPNSGGNVVFLSPGMRVSSNRWSGFVTVGLPIINDLNGLQSEPTYRLFGGVLVGF
ncbi:MAG: hypothetical protein ABW003_11715 [Microvirga sp.]